MNESNASFPIFPRAIRPVPAPLGLYIRVGRSHHKDLSDLIAAGDATCFGAVIDPTVMKAQQELRDQVLGRCLDAILDPKTQPSATPGGYSNALGNLPWGVGRPHVLADFSDTPGRRLIATLGDFAVANGFTQVLSPTHLLRSANDPWFSVDREATQRLRSHLDRNDGSKIPIIYSLAMSYGLFRDVDQRAALIEGLQGIPAASVWLKIDSLGSDSTATAVLNYIEAAKDFHTLGIPVVADHMGGLVGLSLFAFGATGGLAHGVARNERFDAGPWHRPRGGGGGSGDRIYVPSLDLLLKPAAAQLLFDAPARTRNHFVCRDSACCPRGMIDTLENPTRHFLYQRIRDVAGLGQIPEQLRAARFLEQHLRPTTDTVLAASNVSWSDEKLAKKMREQRRRLDALRVALGDLEHRTPVRSISFQPATRAARESHH